MKKVSSHVSSNDIWGMIKCRISAFRNNYTISPGLYAIGEPTKDSDIFVTANYKMSFDLLRRELAGLNAWILVLDTKGINVWCAAGKGTFGTNELIKRITEAKLDALVNHRRIILPQLGAVGVTASIVQKKTGFRVLFGPVRAEDIPAYINNGYKKTPEMSTVQFSLIDRLILTPIEINPFMKKYLSYAAFILLIFGLQPSGILFQQAWSGGLPFLTLGLVSIISGAFLTPVLLPFIPFRSFAIKGWIMGLASVFFATQLILPLANPFLIAAAFMFFPAVSSYIALQFTGATTFTGISGVKRELKFSIPLYFAATGISLVLIILFKIKEMTNVL
ncbi:MAG: mercury methylation corrinoid protein HgcA [Nitrospirota bacterium]